MGFYGAIRGELLEEFGVEVGSPDISYEAEIWTINDIVIKAVLNPDPAGQRPFYVASFEPIPGSILGANVQLLVYVMYNVYVQQQS